MDRTNLNRRWLLCQAGAAAVAAGLNVIADSSARAADADNVQPNHSSGLFDKGYGCITSVASI